jgi:hypothetical protein
MNKPGMNRFVRLACSILMAVFLVLSTGAAASAQKYSVTIYSNVEKSICVGQTADMTVLYRLNKGQKETAAPIISMVVTHGTVAPQKAPGLLLGSDFLNFTFTATEPGVAKIFAQANQGDGSGSMTITVLKECKYTYNLVATLHVKKSNEDAQWEWEEVIKAKGTFTLVAPGLEQLANLTPDTMEGHVNVLNMHTPPDLKCNDSATVWTRLGGTGTVMVSGELENTTNGGVTITFSNAKVTGSDSFATPCKDKTISTQFTTDFSPQESPFIQEHFPPQGETRNIKIVWFDKAAKNLSAGAGTSASYSAVLTVTRVK